MPLAAAWVTKNPPLTLVLKWSFQLSSVTSNPGEGRVMPALFTRISMRPISCSAVATPACTWERSRTSISILKARRWCDWTWLTVASRLTPGLSDTATSAPAWAKPTAIAAPRPVAAPVTRAILPSNWNMRLPLMILSSFPRQSVVLISFDPHPCGDSVGQHVLQVALSLCDLGSFLAGLGSHPLIGASLEKLAHPDTTGITGRAAGWQNVVGADGLVAISHGSFFSDKQQIGRASC